MEERPDYDIGQTGGDAAAEFYAKLRASGFPQIVTAQAYQEASLTFEALALEIEAFEAGMFSE